MKNNMKNTLEHSKNCNIMINKYLNDNKMGRIQIRKN